MKFHYFGYYGSLLVDSDANDSRAVDLLRYLIYHKIHYTIFVNISLGNVYSASRLMSAPSVTALFNMRTEYANFLYWEHSYM